MKAFTLSLASLFAVTVGASAQSISEPHTLFYGKVLSLQGGEAQPLTSGELRWTIARTDRPDDEGLALTTSVQPFADGEFSYQIRVPHEALSAGLTTRKEVIPLPILTVNQSLMELRYNGLRAVVAPPSESVFKAGQTRRADLVRLDILVTGTLPDSDGDGLPDWWEDRFGLDRLVASDAGTDLDGDGFDNLTEFQNGTDPLKADIAPELLTTAQVVYADRLTGLHLEVFDPENDLPSLRLTLTQVPENGSLRLQDSNHALETGAVLSVAEVAGGQLVYEHRPTDDSFSDDAVGFRISGIDRDFPAVDASIDLRLFEPDPELAATLLNSDQRNRRTAFGQSADHRYVVWDFSARDDAPPLDFGFLEAPQLFVGTSNGDVLAGSRGSDLFLLDAGPNVVTGSRGADRFLLAHQEDYANQTIRDFDPMEGDVLDVSIALQDAGGWALDFLELQSEALLVDPDTAAGPEPAFVIDLPGAGFHPSDLIPLMQSGNIVAANLELPTVVTIAATKPEAGETGPTPGEIKVTRTGSLTKALIVQLSISGTATNGVDYAAIESVVRFGAGQSEARITIEVFPDNEKELNEIVDVRLVGGAGYVTGRESSGRVTIEDLKALLTIEPLVAKGTVDPPSPASFVLKRSGDIGSQLLIHLEFGGTAVNGMDYALLPAFVTLDPNETIKQIEIMPMPEAVFPKLFKTIVIAPAADPAYKLNGHVEASVVIFQRFTTYDEWLAETGGVQAERTLSEYAFPTGAPVVNLEDGRLELRFEPNPAATDLVYVAEFSNDLVHWSGDPNVVHEVPQPNSPSLRFFQTERPVADAPRQFLRLRPVLK